MITRQERLCPLYYQLFKPYSSDAERLLLTKKISQWIEIFVFKLFITGSTIGSLCIQI